MGCSLKFSTAHHPQTDGLAERMIQNLEDMIRRHCAFGMMYDDNEGYTHDWISLLPGLQSSYNSKIHSTTGKTPFDLERGYILNPPRPFLNNNLGKLDLHLSSSSFSHVQAMARDHAKECVSTAFAYEKKKWDKSHLEPSFKAGNQVLVSTVNFHNLTTNQKLKDPFIGPFPIIELVGKNALRLELHGAFSRRHPVFPLSLKKMCKESDKKIFPGRALHKRSCHPWMKNLLSLTKSPTKELSKMALRKDSKLWFFFHESNL